MQIDGRSLQSRSRAAWLSSLAGAPAFDALERQQSALSTTHLPHLVDMESPNDTVVRLETNFGDIDVELYNSAAPITVSNFLKYVNSGRLGDTFFHRSSLSPSPFVLQGGGYQYTDAGGLVTVATDAPIVRETTGKSNLARTLAMARTGDITSATSQFFINYVDNTFLDQTAADNGYAVFAKVIQGWDVVLNIEALQSVDLTGSAAFAGPEASNFGEAVPVGSSFVLECRCSPGRTWRNLDLRGGYQASLRWRGSFRSRPSSLRDSARAVRWRLSTCSIPTVSQEGAYQVIRSTTKWASATP